MKWGEYSNDVQFILQWSDSSKSQLLTKAKAPVSSPVLPNITIESPTRQKEFLKSPGIKY